jgi:hypothetical protein
LDEKASSAAGCEVQRRRIAREVSAAEERMGNEYRFGVLSEGLMKEPDDIVQIEGKLLVCRRRMWLFADDLEATGEKNSRSDEEDEKLDET